MQKNFIKMTVISLAVMGMTGCAQLKDSVFADAVKSNDRIEANRGALVNSIKSSNEAKIAAQDVGRPYIAGNSKPLDRVVNLPEILRRPTPITALVQNTPVDLQTAAAMLSDITKISITATTDALLPPSSFALKSSATGGLGQSPSRVVVRAQNRPLFEVLDDLARQASVSWRPVNGGAEFYRLETRVFYMAAIPQNANTSASLGRNGGTNAVFESHSKTSFETKDQNLLKGVILTVDALLSNAGKASISAENQTLIVTDTKENLDRIEAFVKEQNKALSRRVRVLIEAIEVVDKSNSELGVDWTTLYQTTAGALNMTPIGSLAGAMAGTVGWKNPEGTSGAVIKALNEIGVVVNRRSFPFLTTSGRPVTQALRSTFNYVDQVQAAQTASAIGTAPVAPTVTQKDETTGTFVTVVPTAKADGTVFLSISFDVTSAQPLVPFSVGGVTVQQKTIDGTGVIQEVPVRSGQTVVIGGIETNTAQHTQRRLGLDFPILFGGSDATKQTRSRMVLLATAVVEEGV